MHISPSGNSGSLTLKKIFEKVVLPHWCKLRVPTSPRRCPPCVGTAACIAAEAAVDKVTGLTAPVVAEAGIAPAMFLVWRVTTSRLCALRAATALLCQMRALLRPQRG